MWTWFVPLLLLILFCAVYIVKISSQFIKSWFHCTFEIPQFKSRIFEMYNLRAHLIFLIIAIYLCVVFYCFDTVSRTSHREHLMSYIYEFVGFFSHSVHIHLPAIISYRNIENVCFHIVAAAIWIFALSQLFRIQFSSESFHQMNKMTHCKTPLEASV